MCQQTNTESPEFQVLLNDLPENDFNAIFKTLPAFHERLKKDKGDKLGPCFISGTPGSFYGRLFPSQCVHLVHSSYSLHCVSQVPRGVVNNKGNIYIAKSSPPNVFKAYMDQFHTDFSMFLCSRAKEILPGGRMILTFIGRSNDVDSFNLPYYEPCMEEVKAIIEDEGSFNVDRLQMFEFNDPNGDIDNKYQSAQSMANG
ncbi:salicylate/benzoate carboxyl methyltransferase [Quercus suber]|uniref:Salicylate/benzoate carboxyl methyltransferase n=1 Tax=Quercus suber TaxID=58331 RepID=A0AAW0KRE1_QUESU